MNRIKNSVSDKDARIRELEARVADLEREQKSWQYQSDQDVANAERLPLVEAENAALRENKK
jgi:hypothetical protein